MRKKDLLTMKPREPSTEMISRARKDTRRDRSYEIEAWTHKCSTGYTLEKTKRKAKSYGTRLYLTAKKENGFIIIGVFARARLKKGNTEPFFTTYIDAKAGKWLSMLGGKWTEAYFERITWQNEFDLTKGARWECAEDVFDAECLQLVNQELGTNEKDIAAALDAWQTGARKDAAVRRAKKRAAYWESQMAKIPPEPADFDEWVRDEATLNSNFIFYRRKGKQTEAYCTHCEYTWKTPVKMVHNPGAPTRYDHKRVHTDFCPNCHAMLETKAWGKQKALQTEDRLTLMLPAGEYVAFRGYWVGKTFRRQIDSLGDRWVCAICVIEDIRVLANRLSFQSVESYTRRTDTTLNRLMWADTREYTTVGRVPMMTTRGTPYMRNMEQVLEGSYVRPEVLKLFTVGGNEYMQQVLATAARKRYVEYVIKAGLTNLANLMLKHDLKTVIANENANNLKDLLGLDGQQLYMLKQVNGTNYTIHALRYAKEHGEKLPIETLKMITENDISVSQLNLGRTGMTLQRMVNYMLRQRNEMGMQSFHDTVRLYSDYLDMAWGMGMDLKDEIICHTSKLREMHDRYAEEKNRNKDRFNANLADRKFAKISEKYEENAEHFKYSKAGLTILVPTCASDIQIEGKRQHHCVGASDRYMSRMNEGESFILFLRKEEAKEEPYYTLEVEYDGKVRQSYGAYDRKPDWDKVEPVLIGFTRAIGKRTQRERQMAAG